MTNEEILEKFNYNLMPSVADLALNLARADERDNKWISCEERQKITELIQAALIIGCRRGARLANKFISHKEAEEIIGDNSKHRLANRIFNAPTPPKQ